MRRLARWLLVAGTVAAVLGFSKIHAAWIAEPPYDFTGSSRFAWALAYTAVLLLCAYAVGLPDLVSDARSGLGLALAAPAAAAVAMSMVQFLTGDAQLPRYVVFASAAVLVPWYALTATISASGRRRAEARDLVVVVARPDVVEDLRAELERAPERHATVVVELRAEDASGRATHSKPLVDAVLDHRATVVVLDVAAQADDTIVAQAATLHESGIRIRSLSLFYEEWLGKIPVVDLERVSLMFDIGEIHRTRYGRLKRVADLGLGLVGLVPLAVAVPFVMVGNVIANRGPLLYSQQRTGRWGRSFRIFKFRTMRPGAPSQMSHWTAQRDPRVTPFGRLLRITHVDELPQMVNIVRGDLSIVGPRPEQPHYVAELVEKIPFYDLRHKVRPGLTGWAQVKYGYAGDERDALEKLQYDFYYLRHQGLALDSRIVGRTLRSIVGLGGR